MDHTKVGLEVVDIIDLRLRVEGERREVLTQEEAVPREGSPSTGRRV